jgi:ankyrin repeat protein
LYVVIVGKQFSGADIETENNLKTALHYYAAIGGHLSSEFAIGNGVSTKNRDTALQWASGEGHSEVVKLLLEKGADVKARDEDGGTALLWAALRGRLYMAMDTLTSPCRFLASHWVHCFLFR